MTADQGDAQSALTDRMEVSGHGCQAQEVLTKCGVSIVSKLPHTHTHAHTHTPARVSYLEEKVFYILTLINFVC